MLVFVTAVKHPDNSTNYNKVWKMLNNTLASVCGQLDTNFRVIVVCDKKLPFNHHRELIEKYTEVIEVNIPPQGKNVISDFNKFGNLTRSITDRKMWVQWSEINNPNSSLSYKIRMKVLRKFKPGEWRTYMSRRERTLMANYAINRGLKQYIGMIAAKKYTPDHVLNFDADDFVANDISGYVAEHPNENGWIMTHGYKLFRDKVAPFYAENSFCGTGNIINFRYILPELPDELTVKSSYLDIIQKTDSEFLIVLARHGKIRKFFEQKGIQFQDFPTPSAIHNLSHDESNEYQRRKLRHERSSQRYEVAKTYSEFQNMSDDLISRFNISRNYFNQINFNESIQKNKWDLSTILKGSGQPIATVSGTNNISGTLTVQAQKLQKKYQRFAEQNDFPSQDMYNLTICDDPKFLWFRVAKVATRTTFDILNQAGIELTAEQPGDIYYPVNHYKDHFKFAFIRNPWDRVVSYWLDKRIQKNNIQLTDEKSEFELFIDNFLINQDLEIGNRHFRLQTRLIDLNNIDFLGRLETFQDDITEVMSILGIEAMIRKRNSTERKADYREYYTLTSKDKIAKLYRKDIDIFGYEF